MTSEEALEVLRRCEWAGQDHNRFSICPVCLQRAYDEYGVGVEGGHLDDCKLDELISAIDEIILDEHANSARTDV